MQKNRDETHFSPIIKGQQISLNQQAVFKITVDDSTDQVDKENGNQPDTHSSGEKDGKIKFNQTVAQITHTVGGEKKKSKKLNEV